MSNSSFYSNLSNQWKSWLALAIFTVIFLLLLIKGILQPKLFTDREYWCYLVITFLWPISIYTLLLGKKRYELLGVFFTSLLFMGMSLLMYYDVDYSETYHHRQIPINHKIVGALAATMGLLGVACSVYMARLRLHSKDLWEFSNLGITLHYILGSDHLILWEEIKGFKQIEVNHTEMVGIQLKHPMREISYENNWLTRWNMKFTYNTTGCVYAMFVTSMDADHFIAHCRKEMSCHLPKPKEEPHSGTMSHYLNQQQRNYQKK